MLESLKNVTAASTDHNVLAKSKNIAAVKVAGNTVNNNGYVTFSTPTTNLKNLDELILGSDNGSVAVEKIVAVSISLYKGLF